MPKLLTPTAPTEENHRHIHVPASKSLTLQSMGFTRRGILTASAALCSLSVMMSLMIPDGKSAADDFKIQVAARIAAL